MAEWQKGKHAASYCYYRSSKQSSWVTFYMIFIYAESFVIEFQEVNPGNITSLYFYQNLWVRLG